MAQLENTVSANEPIYSQQFDLSHLALNDELGFSSEKLPYRVFDKSGKFIVAGHTNQDGLRSCSRRTLSISSSIMLRFLHLGLETAQ